MRKNYALSGIVSGILGLVGGCFNYADNYNGIHEVDGRRVSIARTMNEGHVMEVEEGLGGDYKKLRFNDFRVNYQGGVDFRSWEFTKGNDSYVGQEKFRERAEEEAQEIVDKLKP